jgi:hypothetical protein
MVATIRLKLALLLCLLVLVLAITNAGISGSKGKAVHHIPHKLQGNIRGKDLRVVTGHVGCISINSFQNVGSYEFIIKIEKQAYQLAAKG